MKIYNYKIQWLFSVKESFNEDKKTQLKNLFSVIKGIGSRSLTCVQFRDEEFKIIDTYTNMFSYSYPVSDKKTISYIRKALKKFQNISYIELIR